MGSTNIFRKHLVKVFVYDVCAIDPAPPQHPSKEDHALFVSHIHCLGLLQKICVAIDGVFWSCLRPCGCLYPEYIYLLSFSDFTVYSILPLSHLTASLLLQTCQILFPIRRICLSMMHKRFKRCTAMGYTAISGLV